MQLCLQVHVTAEAETERLLSKEKSAVGAVASTSSNKRSPSEAERERKLMAMDKYHSLFSCSKNLVAVVPLQSMIIMDNSEDVIWPVSLCTFDILPISVT